MSPTPTNRSAKSHYTESEAAVALGVSVEQLRTLIRSHIVKTDEDMAHVAAATYQPSDLLVLRMILKGMSTAQLESVPAATV
ncbi:MAG: hypothetical protein JNK87_15445 [Bryobacterales bacterium]|nr:hypothetical protein [Bryobacterales bacterium]